MTYTEIKKKNRKIYYYRVRSIRIGKKFRKERVYLGLNLSDKSLAEKEIQADKILLKERVNRDLDEIRPQIIRILKKNGIKRAGIFGSFARGEQKKNSDIDILIQPRKNIGFGFAGIEIELEKKLKRKVDLVSYNGISPYLKDKILRQEVRII
jgi:hypothetical protein